MLVEEFLDSCLVQGYLLYSNGMILAISKSPCYQKDFHQVSAQEKIYSLEEDVGSRIPRWLYSAWPS